MKSYKDYLKMKRLKPIVIERTTKRPGDHVIVSSYKPAEIIR